jgi:hypothetical protein
MEDLSSFPGKEFMVKVNNLIPILKFSAGYFLV